MKKGYKAYEKGLVCRGKQYKIGEIFEEEKAEICDIGMHYCENPLDCLDHYPLIDDNGEIVEMTEVEDLDEENRDTENNKKYCTKKLKIGAKLSLGEMIKASLEFIGEKSIEPASSGYYSQLASSGDNSQLASSGDNSQLASSGDRSRLASSGDCSRLASSGYYSQLASSGDRSRLASSGDCSRLASSGYYSQLASSGYYSQLASSGDNSQLASSGDNSQLASSGDNSQLASSGDRSRLASSGDYSQLASSGNNSAVANIGINGMAKAAKYSWITLAEHCWEDGLLKLKCVKTEQVDGDRIKPDTWYKLQDGEFKEV